MKTWVDFLTTRLTEAGEIGDEYWQKRLAQFQAAQSGVKGAIDKEPDVGTTYKAQRIDRTEVEKPKEFVKMFDGLYEKMTPEDENDGLTTLSRWNNPAFKSKAYYSQGKDGRFYIVRPQKAVAFANRGSR